MQPIAHVTQFISMMRNIIDDEDQLARIQDLQDQFFNDMAGENALIKEHL